MHQFEDLIELTQWAEHSIKKSKAVSQKWVAAKR